MFGSKARKIAHLRGTLAIERRELIDLRSASDRQADELRESAETMLDAVNQLREYADEQMRLKDAAEQERDAAEQELTDLGALFIETVDELASAKAQIETLEIGANRWIQKLDAIEDSHRKTHAEMADLRRANRELNTFRLNTRYYVTQLRNNSGKPRIAADGMSRRLSVNLFDYDRLLVHIEGITGGDYVFWDGWTMTDQPDGSTESTETGNEATDVQP